MLHSPHKLPSDLQCLENIPVLVHSRVVQPAWSNLGLNLIYCGLVLQRGRKMGRLTEERQLKLIALVHMSVNNRPGWKQFIHPIIQVHEVCRCSAAAGSWKM